MNAKLDEKDLAILTLIQENSKLTANQIAKKISAPITTVFAKTKRMGEMGIIKQYRAILSGKTQLRHRRLHPAAVSYRTKRTIIQSHKDRGRNRTFPEVQEVHIITGDWICL